MSFLVAIFAFGFLIFIHELGHFIAAVQCGIRVEKFSIGFGPRLIGFIKDETDYCISIIPFGGYVKMAGEDPTERKEDDVSGSPADDNPTGEFYTAPVRHRLLVAIAGPVVNLIFGVIAFAFMFMIWGEETTESMQSTKIGYIQPESAASAADLQVGDKIISVDGRQVNNWPNLTETIMLTPPGKVISLDLIRNGQPRTITSTTSSRRINSRTVSQLGILPYQTLSIIDGDRIDGLQKDDQIMTVDKQSIHSDLAFREATQQGLVTLDVRRNGKLITVEDILVNWQFRVVGDVKEDEEKGDFQDGDQILQINGQPVTDTNLTAFSQRLESLAVENMGQPVVFRLQRGTKEVTTYITPKVKSKRIGNGMSVDWHGLQISHSPTNLTWRESEQKVEFGFFSAWERGIKESGTTIEKTLTVVKKLFTQKNTIGLVSGPVGILNIMSRQSGKYLIRLVAFISINLCIVNLIPFLIMTDGGQIALFLLELVRGKPLPHKYQAGLQYVALALIIFVFAYTTFNDVLDLIVG